MKVSENVKTLWKHSPAAHVPTAFLILPKFHSCFYNSIETQYMFFYFLKTILHALAEKQKFLLSPRSHVVSYLHFMNTPINYWKPVHFCCERCNPSCNHGNGDLLLVKRTCYFYVWRCNVFIWKLTWHFIGAYTDNKDVVLVL